MLKNHKIQMFGLVLLIAAALFVSISAFIAPTAASIPVTGSNSESLAQYLRSERSARVSNPNGLAIYHQSERVLSYPARKNADGLAIYYLSERMQPVNWTKTSDPLYKYHQSEWHGK